MRLFLCLLLFSGEAFAGLTLGRDFLPQYTWPRGVVPYTIDKSITDTKPIEEAILHYQKKTLVRFVKKETQRNWVTFKTTNDTASSDIGMQGGEQFIYLTPDVDTDTVIHEMGHALGLYHEQARSDRDRFVKVLYENMDLDARDEFDIEPSGQMVGPYDLHSIMHYGSDEFSSNGKPTITLLDGKTDGVGGEGGLSEGDVRTIRYLVTGVPSF